MVDCRPDYGIESRPTTDHRRAVNRSAD